MARIKRVFGSHDEVAHIWANNDDPGWDGTAGRVFFDGFCLFSYGRHHVIARKVKLPRGVTIRSAWHDQEERNAPAQPYVVLENCADVSISTRTHHSIMLRAASQFRTFRVPYPALTITPGEREFKQAEEHRKNLLYLVKQAEAARDEMKRSTRAPEGYERLRQCARDATEYAQVFRLRAPKLPVLQWCAEIKAVHAERARKRAVKTARWEARSAELIERYKSGDIDASRALDRAPRFIAERIAREYGDTFAANMRAWLLGNEADTVTLYRNGDDTMPLHEARRKAPLTREELIAKKIRQIFRDDYTRNAGARLRAAYPEAVALYTAGDDTSLNNGTIPRAQAMQIEDVFNAEYIIARNAFNIAEWRAGKGRCYFSGHIPVMLRVNGENFETSQGAQFPIEHGRRALPLLLRVRERLNDNEPRFVMDEAIRLGNFSVSEVTRNGVRAGCHFVKWDEICSAARLIGLNCDAVPDDVDYGAIYNSEG